jgi:uncharacterized spore protein YtfJ
MTNGIQKIDAAGLESQHQAIATLDKLFTVAQSSAVFSTPVKAGDYTVITASEVSVGMGLGFAGGGGSDEGGSHGSGGGGGGGGASLGRPVAAIAIGRDGVTVEPIVDVTKLGIAFLTAMGAMFMAWRAMRKSSKR